MKLTLLATLASTTTAFFTASPLLQPQSTSRVLTTRIYAEEAEGDATPAPRSAQEISSLTSSVKTVFSLEDVAKILPHRYPFLLVDKVVEYEMGKVSWNVNYFQLHTAHLCVSTRRSFRSLSAAATY